jgi:hypothetical protein
MPVEGVALIPRCVECEAARTDARARDESEAAMAASAGGRGMGQMGLSLQTGAAT